MDTTPLSPPLSNRPRIDPKSITYLLQTLSYNISLPTILLIGAFFQILLTTLLPTFYASIPVILLLTYRITHTILITYDLIPNPYLKDSIPKKSTAQPPPENGSLVGAGKEKIAILLLGAKSNHPLGVFAPDMNIIGSFLGKMTHELETDKNHDNGFLGQTLWTRPDANGATELLYISYWRSLEAVHQYAHGPLHREAWRYWDKTFKLHNYIGFMHEVFEAPAGMWESLYINFQPTLLGASTYIKKSDGKMAGGTLGKEWINPLVDANRGPMRTSMGRRGLKDKKELIGDMFDKNAYEY